jgi:chaperonin cofactor prefoldin
MASWAEEKAAGNEAYKAGDFDAAAAKYTDALKHEDLTLSDRATLLSNRAQAWIRKGEHAAAEEDCTAALALEPTNVKAMFRRASSREAIGDKPGALADYRAVLELQPGQAESRRAVIRLDPTSVEPAGPRGGARRQKKKISAEDARAIQEAQTETMRLQQQIQQATQRTSDMAKQQRINAITRSEVSKAAEDASLFQHVGKMFVRVPRATHLSRLDAAKASLDSQQGALAQVVEGLQGKLKAANATLKEAAAAAGIRVAIPGESA